MAVSDFVYNVRSCAVNRHFWGQWGADQPAFSQPWEMYNPAEIAQPQQMGNEPQVPYNPYQPVYAQQLDQYHVEGHAPAPNEIEDFVSLAQGLASPPVFDAAPVDAPMVEAPGAAAQDEPVEAPSVQWVSQSATTSPASSVNDAEERGDGV